MKIGFVSCSSKKLKGKMLAKNLYNSDLFRKAYNYATKYYDKVYILSAKYGALNPEDFICDYDLTLNSYNKAQQQKWAYMVHSQLSNKISINDELYWLCGVNYKKYLMIVLKNKHHEPLKGKRIGCN